MAKPKAPQGVEVRNYASVYIMTPEGRHEQVEVPTHRIVCPACNGEGVLAGDYGYVYTHEDCYSPEDGPVEDHYEYYHKRETTKQCCFKCNGNNVVDVPDLSKLTPEQKQGHKLAEEHNDAIEAMHRSEKRYGC
jgi:hypothetical protein